MKFNIPQPLIEEHEALHEQLKRATKLPGATGEAARAVATLMHPHFEKEEAYALPPLGLLASLARGEISAQMREVLPLTERLEANLPAMLAEHRAIVAALDRLADAARTEGHDEVVDFVSELKLHAQTEEEVAYPAAILVGAYVARVLPA